MPQESARVKLQKQLNQKTKMRLTSSVSSWSRGLSSSVHFVIICAILVKVSSFSTVSPSRTKPKFKDGSSIVISGPYQSLKLFDICSCSKFQLKKSYYIYNSCLRYVLVMCVITTKIVCDECNIYYLYSCM